jgi:hypothetical protein
MERIRLTKYAENCISSELKVLVLTINLEGSKANLLSKI